MTPHPSSIQAVIREMDKNYSRTDAHGIYRASEPVYGFRADSPRNGLVINYIRAYRLLRSLSCFTSLNTIVDVGGGEGYTAFLIKSLLHTDQVVNADISPAACQRASDIFHLPSEIQDITKLTFSGNSFDVVVCSETLEHIPDYQQALSELIRVARLGVVITIPHEPPQIIEKSKTQSVPGDHIHAFTAASFNYLKKDGYILKVDKMLSPLLYLPNTLVDASPREYNQFYSRQGIPLWVIRLYNAATPVLKRFFDARAAVKLVHLDEWLTHHTPWHQGIVITIVKEGTLLPPKPVSVTKLINCKVPFYYLKTKP
jgi:ubiquinone/menaquinone biosynthesis C-methylase UbiE